MTVESQAVEQTEVAAAPAAPSLQLSDLRTMLSVIEIVSQRGAFKADELVVVGTLYNRINAFVAAATPAEEEAATPAEEEAVAEEAAAEDTDAAE